jgi:hypothetical protein
MYSEKLERLIELALADGILTDKEKEILLKTAKAEGIDPDELEMVLEGRLYERTNKPENKATPQTSKHGDVKKCPACGAILQTLSTECSDCGYEFRNIEANSSVKTLADKLERIVEECSKKSYLDEFRRFDDNTPLSESEKIFGRFHFPLSQAEKMAMERLSSEKKKEEILSRQRVVIENLPVPNTREDILELLSFISPKLKVSILSERDENYDAWNKKFIEIMNRAEKAYSNNKEMMYELSKYKHNQSFSKTLFTSLSIETRGMIVFFLILIILSIILSIMDV